MSGYCHFNPTGNQWVDHILNMVTEAGNSFHHTESWQESEGPDDPSHIEIIEAAANVAANKIAALEAEVASLKESASALDLLMDGDSMVKVITQQRIDAAGVEELRRYAKQLESANEALSFNEESESSRLRTEVASLKGERDKLAKRHDDLRFISARVLGTQNKVGATLRARVAELEGIDTLNTEQINADLKSQVTRLEGALRSIASQGCDGSLDDDCGDYADNTDNYCVACEARAALSPDPVPAEGSEPGVPCRECGSIWHPEFLSSTGLCHGCWEKEQGPAQQEEPSDE